MKKTILICTIGILAACSTKPLEVTIPQQESKTVVFSQVVPNRVMIIALTKSFGALDFQEEEDSLTENFLNNFLEDSATVTVSYNGNTDTLFRVEKGLYASINTIQYTNSLYELRIINSRGETVTSASNMLPQINFDSIRPIVYRGADTSTSIHFSFTDDPLAENFYMINYYKKNLVSGGLDINSIFNNGENNLIRTDIVSDIEFGEVFTDSVRFGSESLLANDTIAVSLSNISKEYYQFLDQRARSENIFTEITREPITYPTNVVNGYGFFNTHFPDVSIFDLNQY